MWFHKMTLILNKRINILPQHFSQTTELNCIYMYLDFLFAILKPNISGLFIKTTQLPQNVTSLKVKFIDCNM